MRHVKENKLRVMDAFSGIGALHKSLKRLDVPTRITSMSEIDPDAIISYAGVHIDNFKHLEFEYPEVEEMKKWLMDRGIGYSYEKNKSSIPKMRRSKLEQLYKASFLLNNLGDISKIDPKDIPDFDLMNFSFSCTDLSNAGKQKGMCNADGTPTRSGLYVYGINIIKEKMPKYVMIENVKGLIQKKFLDDFYSIVKELDEVGYNCFYPTKDGKPVCLNASNFEIPQNRERIFVICIRKDVGVEEFQFPTGSESEIRFKDFLEDNVDEKFYLPEEYMTKFLEITKKKPSCADPNKNTSIRLGGVFDEERCKHQAGSVWDTEGLCPTLDTMQGGYRQPCILDKGRLRKITPLEAWLLMGFDKEDFKKAEELGVSNSQLYKQAGNSIVVNCLTEIFRELLKEYIVA